MILSAAMMFDWLGERHGDDDATAAGEQIEQAVCRVLAAGETLTGDLGGSASTSEVADAVVSALSAT
jgi:3-isopropylmalate dehydrogenase